MHIQRDPHALFMPATRMLRNTQVRHRMEALRDNGRMSHDLSPAQARARALRGALLIDIRQPHERVSGQAEGALAIAQADLEQAPAQHLPDRDCDILLICQSGKRSAQTAAQLREQGYPHALSVLGGTTAWSRDGLPLVRPTLPPDEVDFLERYSRHLRLPQVGIDGQQRLARARVLLIGAGGLGSPAAFYLAAAGIGHLRIADDDVVDRSNLQRQILHTEDSVGVAKVVSAAQRIAALNPRVQVDAIQTRVTASNVEALLQDVDVVVDGADNFAARYLLNDACVKLGKPLVYGAVQQFEGQLSVFDAGRHRGQLPCYRRSVSRTAAAGVRTQLRRSRCARCAARGDRPVAGCRGDQALAWARRQPGRAPAQLRRIGHALSRDPPAARSAVPGVRTRHGISRLCRLRHLLRHASLTHGG